MPDKCVVFGCNNRPSKTERISLHPIPFEGADEPEKRKRRKKWVDFVKSKRAHWEPTKYSAVCSKHFRDDDYEVMFPGLTNVHLQRRLRKDGIGICVFPTIQAPCVSGESIPESKRASFQVLPPFFFLLHIEPAIPHLQSAHSHRHPLVHHLRFRVRSSLTNPRPLSRTRPPFLRPPTPS
ncbi:THAP domain-containing protein 1 A-like [Acropora millepora]|uniref:THAP domain-containing protein 1 A-like n=1 Tax=Acropora millepora TaxID=45264 RepID=UPI001CF3F078|nr:THAP domain-containing protein 1 A-like [Acropora millepora]